MDPSEPPSSEPAPEPVAPLTPEQPTTPSPVVARMAVVGHRGSGCRSRRGRRWLHDGAFLRQLERGHDVVGRARTRTAHPPPVALVRAHVRVRAARSRRSTGRTSPCRRQISPVRRLRPWCGPRATPPTPSRTSVSVSDLQAGDNIIVMGASSNGSVTATSINDIGRHDVRPPCGNGNGGQPPSGFSGATELQRRATEQRELPESQHRDFPTPASGRPGQRGNFTSRTDHVHRRIDDHPLQCQR